MLIDGARIVSLTNLLSLSPRHCPKNPWSEGVKGVLQGSLWEGIGLEVDADVGTDCAGPLKNTGWCRD